MRIADYEFYGMPPDLIDFKDEVTTLVNWGKYAYAVTNGVPTYVAQEGEGIIYNAAGIRRIYYYINNAWDYLVWNEYFVIENRTSDPASPAVGQMWFRTDV